MTEILTAVCDGSFLLGGGIFAVYALLRLYVAGAFDGVRFLFFAAFFKKKAERGREKRQILASKRAKGAVKCALWFGAACLAVSVAALCVLKIKYYA